MNRKLFALMTQLTQRQEAFAQAYAEEPNGAAAARAAGYAPSGAKQEASRLLADPDIAARIEALMLAAAERRAHLADDLSAKLATILEAELAAGARGAARDTIRLQAQIAGLIGGRVRT